MMMGSLAVTTHNQDWFKISVGKIFREELVALHLTGLEQNAYCIQVNQTH